MNKIEVPECDGWEEVYQSTNLPHAVRQLQDRVAQLIDNQNELISRWEAIDEWEAPMMDRLEAIHKQLDRHDHWISEHDIGEVVSEIEKPEPGYWWCKTHHKHLHICAHPAHIFHELEWRTDKPDLCPICGGEIWTMRMPKAGIVVRCFVCEWSWYGESIEQWRRIVG